PETEQPDTDDTEESLQTLLRDRLLRPERKHAGSGLALTLYALLLIAFIAVLAAIIAVTVSQLRSLANYLPDLIENADPINRITQFFIDLSERLGGFLTPDMLTALEDEMGNLQQRLLETLPNLAAGLLNSVGQFLSSLPLVLFTIIIIVMSGYYFIVDRHKMQKFIQRNLISRRFRDKGALLLERISSTLFRIIGGYLLLLLVTFAEVLVGLLILRIPYAVIIALIVSIVDFLPVLGASATMVPIGVYLIFTGNLFAGIGVLVLLLILTLIRRVIEPPILGNAMRLHPLATIAAMIIGIRFYGLIGIVVGPLILYISREVIHLFGFDSKIRQWIGAVLNHISPADELTGPFRTRTARRMIWTNE
ncbi:MAG: AI-2E family transporter, partial [Eubacteriales bacterium]|nr:AI-2E family transporter [Eubacteriales bacterium]